MELIHEFRGRYRFLSNFVRCRIEYEGIVYGSVEAAYQAQKTLDIGERQYIARMSASAAKGYGNRHVSLRFDWESVKEQVMLQLLQIKFAHPEFASLLAATGDAQIEEGNTWNDRYWGVCPPQSGNGHNRLGVLLMQVRDAL